VDHATGAVFIRKEQRGESMTLSNNSERMQTKEAEDTLVLCCGVGPCSCRSFTRTLRRDKGEVLV
jgi:hypothetical protein